MNILKIYFSGGYIMEKLVLPALVALFVSFIISNAFAALYNVFVGIPRGIKIKKEKKYKTVTATRVIRGTDSELELMNGGYEGDHKNTFEYEWEAEGKRYKRIIRTASFPSYICWHGWAALMVLPSSRQLRMYSPLVLRCRSLAICAKRSIPQRKIIS